MSKVRHLSDTMSSQTPMLSSCLAYAARELYFPRSELDPALDWRETQHALLLCISTAVILTGAFHQHF